MRTVASRLVWRWAVGGVLLLPAFCLATDVRLVAVTPGRSVSLAIGNAAPVTIAVGETFHEIMLLRANRDSALLRIDGIEKTLPLVADATALGDTTAAAAGSVSLSASAHGEFFANGTINGRPMRFLVDTGATLTTLSKTQAQRIGIRYERAPVARMRTASGIVNGWRVSLNTVRVGGITARDVDAFVADNSTLPFGLLGMSFLAGVEMQRQGSTLVLRQRR